MLSPDGGLIAWQIFMIAIGISWILSVLIIVKASRTRNLQLLLFGAVSLLAPLVTTIPYFLFFRK